MSKNKVLFQLSGSIACFKACQLLSRLVQDGFEVEVVATRGALSFISEATLEGLTGRPAHIETFERGGHMDHIRLARWADLLLLCPATANTLNKFTSGIGDDLLSTLFLAHDFKKPYLIAPAMNASMLAHPTTQASIEKLRSWGVRVLESGRGSLACGETGEGRLLETDEIYAAIRTALADTRPTLSERRLRTLITSGGTREPIDGVRSIANSSTGRTGAAIAEYFVSRGHEVTFLRARDSAAASGVEREREFTTFGDLERALNEELGERSFDAVIHAAAVSDFALERVEASGQTLARGGKIDSESDLVLRLKRNPKLIDGLRAQSRNPEIRVVAFKLTNTPSESERMDAVGRLARHARPDFILHNDLSEIHGDVHRARVFSGREARVLSETRTKREAAGALEEILLNDLERRNT